MYVKQLEKAHAIIIAAKALKRATNSAKVCALLFTSLHQFTNAGARFHERVPDEGKIIAHCDFFHTPDGLITHTRHLVLLN